MTHSDSDPHRDEVAVEIAGEISRFVNGRRHSTENAAKLMAHDHPTIQQGFMRVCVAFIEEMAQKAETGRYDARNEAAVTFAAKVVDKVPDRGMPLI